MKKKRYEVIQDSKQEDSEGSEKRKLDRDLVRGDQTCLNKKKKKKKKTVILKNKRFSANGQNIAQN